ncbi:MAG: hypothetical protein LBH69_03930 [Methanomassiliicoccaceae archaeon]|jgi:hypothetical protein|nr:hypothetical protein [Methanomassiliicoccaceae archaeon]
MSSSTGPKSKRQKERAAQEEAKIVNNKKKMLHVGIGIAGIVAILLVAWFMLQPTPVSMDSMKNSLNDAHYHTTDIATSALPADAVSGFSFSFTEVGHNQKVTIYEFKNGESAEAYAKTFANSTTEGTLTKGVFVLHTNHLDKGEIDDDIVDIFNKLMSGKSFKADSSHDHNHPSS